MSDRNWHQVATHYVRMVREGKCSADDAVNDIELALLGEEDIQKRDCMIKLGDINLGYWRDAFNWLADLSRFKFVRFFGIGWGRCFFGLIRGSDVPTTEEKRQARIQELIERSES